MRKTSIYIQCALYTLAGLNHFWHTETYLDIMPSWLPWHEGLIYISGLIQIALGIAFYFDKTRVRAAWGIIILLLAVYPANFQMAVNYANEDNPYLWAALVRLPLQVPLMFWAYTFTRVPKE
jgi:uncharacterized membrane protein